VPHLHEISDADYRRIEHMLPDRPGQHGGLARDNRQFINAVSWIARTGAAWRDLPDRLGHWNSQWRRFDRRAKAGRFAAIPELLRDPGLDVLVLDSTAVRAHPCAAGAKKVEGPAARTIRRLAAAAAASAPRFTGASTASATPSSCC
jgi:transposase